MTRTLFFIALRLFSALILACVAVGCDKSDSNPVPVTEATGTPIVPDAQVVVPVVPASPVFNGQVPTRVELADAENTYLSQVALVNPGAEAALQTGPIPEDELTQGFRAEGDCRYSRDSVAAGNGRWRFELGPDCSLTQLTDSKLAPGQALTLTFDTHSPTVQDVSLEAQILITGEGIGDIILSRQRIAMTAATSDWQTHQLAIGFGGHDEYTGKSWSIRFINRDTASPVSLDAVSFDLHTVNPNQAIRFEDHWDWQCDQLWAGEQFWSNRLHDWQVVDGRLQTRNASRYRPQRTTHRISSQLTTAPADFGLVVRTGIVSNAGPGAYSGFLVGAAYRMDYRGAALVHNRHGRNGGLIIGIGHQGNVFIHDNGIANRTLANGKDSEASSSTGAILQMDAAYQSDGTYLLQAFASDASGEILSSTSTTVKPVRLLGNIAVVSNPGNKDTAHWFDDWTGFGAKLRELPNRRFGPVLFASYTVSRSTLTINAQYPPACADAFAQPKLQIARNDQWQDIALTSIDSDAYTAQFRVDNWDASVRTRFRIVSEEVLRDNPNTHYFDGVIQADPVNEPEFVVAVYNCRPGVILSDKEGWIQHKNKQAFTWTRERIVVPHEELLDNSSYHNADLLAFLGDQLYEFDPNGLADKEPANIINDYLWKWFQFGWSVRDLMRNTPAFIIPDDHDVYQSNVWGQNGVAAATENAGGYVHPAQFVNVVQRTQTGSLTPAYDPTPVQQAIEVYYTDLVYGGIGMAVLEDRKFKTGPNSPLQPRQLLGDRQHLFLDHWARDWKGQSVKLAFSQSPFTQSTTHSGKDFTRIVADVDSNGWPKEGRDQALRHLRRAFAPHIAGDQHLGMTVKHGIDTADDAVYSFAGPSMLNIFPRIWDPLNLESGAGDRASEYRGLHTDAHGNLINVLAAANPNVYYNPVDPQTSAPKDDLGIGYGIVRINKAARGYTFEAWPANQDPRSAEAKPYDNWPISFNQTDNDGRIPTGYLIARQASVSTPVVTVENEDSNKLIYARRYATATVELPVFDNDASYRVMLSDPETGYLQQFDNQHVQ